MNIVSPLKRRRIVFTLLLVLSIGLFAKETVLTNSAGIGGDPITITLKFRDDLYDETRQDILVSEIQRDFPTIKTIEAVVDTKEITSSERVLANSEKYPDRIERVSEDAEIPKIGLLQRVTVTAQDGAGLIHLLRNDPRFEYVYVHPFEQVPLTVQPNDHFYLSPRNLIDGLLSSATPSWSLKRIGLNPTNDGNQDSGWDITPGVKEVVIAVYGTGIDYTHPDLENNIWINPVEFPDETYVGLDANADNVLTLTEMKTWATSPLIDFNNDGLINLKDLFTVNAGNIFLNGLDDDGNGYVDDFLGWNFQDNNNDVYDDGSYASGHDTTVAAVAAASGDNLIGFTGVAWNVRLMTLKYGNYDDVIFYAVDNGASVINVSWTGQGIGNKTIVDYAYANGVAVVFAAGNSNLVIPYSDSRSEKTILVGSLNADDTRASYSDFGNRLDFSAPGYAVLAPGPSAIKGSGTQMDFPTFTSGVDNTGALKVVVYEADTATLLYGSKSTGSWVYEPITTDVTIAHFPSLDFDNENNPHVAYYDWELRQLRYASKGVGGWTVESVTSTDDQGYFAQLVIDNTDIPHIAFINATNGQIRLAVNDGVWTFSTITSLPAVHILYSTLSLAMGTDQKLRLSFYDAANKDLGYAVEGDGSFAISYPDTVGDVGASSHLALNTSNQPHIVYTDIVNWDSKHAWYDGTWHTEIIYAPVNAGLLDNDIVVNGDGSMIATTTVGTGNLAVMQNSGGGWTSTVLGTVNESYGYYHTTQMVGGIPEILSASRKRGLYDLTYTNPTWATSVIYDLGSSYRLNSGTSFAAPHVSGAIALLMSVHPDWNLDQIYWALASTTSDLGTVNHDQYFGWGVPQLQNALRIATPLDDAVAPTAAVTFPALGATYDKGIITITGTATDTNFTFYNLLYRATPNGVWIPIATYVRTPVTVETLGTLDATLIADGNYEIKLEVYDWYQSTTLTQAFVLAGPTPTPTTIPSPTATPVPTSTPVPTATPIPTETPMPTNTPAPIPTDVPTSTPIPQSPLVPTSTPVRSKGDINADNRVNLVDFSILLYHWGTSFVGTDFNTDGKVNLTDFSILLSNWRD